MKIKEGTAAVQVVLSRRNLKTLLAKLDGAPADSFATIIKEAGSPDNETGRTLFVTAEEDGWHYAGRPPGTMHPDTEAAL